jgi:uncharacterized protein YwbE
MLVFVHLLTMILALSTMHHHGNKVMLVEGAQISIYFV